MCKADLQASKEGIRTYFKSKKFKLKSPKEAYELIEIPKEERSSVRSILIITALKSFLLIRLL